MSLSCNVSELKPDTDWKS